MTVNVLFVCFGNICRSPLAEFVFKDMVEKAGLQTKIYVESAGTIGYHIGDPVDRRSAEVMRKHGISCEGKRSRQIVQSDFDEFDYIIVMDEQNLDDVNEICPPGKDCIIKLLLDYDGGGIVDDPYYTLDFDKAYYDIERGCRGLLKEIEGRLR